MLALCPQVPFAPHNISTQALVGGGSKDAQTWQGGEGLSARGPNIRANGSCFPSLASQGRLHLGGLGSGQRRQHRRRTAPGGKATG